MATELQTLPLGEKYYHTFINNLPPSYRAANLVFAYYAAFPLVFSPDMLYQLWLNFQDYEENTAPKLLPTVVVSDLLQSGMCQEVAFELYELDADFANYLKNNISQLLQNYALKLLYSHRDIAVFTLSYAERYLQHPNRRNLYNMYYWKSLLEAYPERANNSIKEALKNSQTTIAEQDLLFYLADKQATEPKTDETAQEYSKLPIFAFSPAKDHVNISDESLARQIAGRLGLKEGERESKTATQTIIHAVIIGIDNYSYRIHGSCIFEANAMKDCLLEIASYQNIDVATNLIMLLDEQATKNNILDNLKNAFQKANEEDIVLFVFSGNDLHDNKMTGVDSELVDNKLQNGISLEEWGLAINQYRKPNTQFVMIFDSGLVSPTWGNNRNDILLAASIEHCAVEFHYNNQTRSFFCKHLIEQIRIHKGDISYEDIIDNIAVIAQSNKNVSPVPKLIASQSGHLFFLNKRKTNIALQLIEQALKINATRLDLSNLGLTEIQEGIDVLTRLQELDLSNNKITDLRTLLPLYQKGVNIVVEGNPITNPPMEVVGQGREGILAYFEEKEEQANTSIKIFIAYDYDDRDNSDLFNQFQTSLLLGLDNAKVKLWHHGMIIAGELWHETIKQNLHDSDIILLLLSAGAIASNYFWEQKNDALARYQRGDCLVVPIILRPCLWELTDIVELQVLPQSGAPITTWANRDQAFQSVSKSIYELVEKWQDNSLQKTTPTKIAELGSWGYVGQKRLSKKQTNTPVKIFIVYSHEDTTYFHELRKHLKILERSYFVKISNNNEIIARSMQQVYEEELYNADFILFLVSAYLIASDEHSAGAIASNDFWEQKNDALAHYQRGECLVVPIILRPCLWELTDIVELQVLPQSGAPITTWANRDEAFHSVSKSIYELVKKWQDNSLQKTIPTKIAELGSWGYVGQKRLSKKQTNTPIKIFIAYDDKDRGLLDQFQPFLLLGSDNANVKIWYYNMIGPVKVWDETIKQNLHDSDIILLLLSADAIASNDFWEQKNDALAHYQRGDCLVVPIILRPCLWELTDIVELQVLPQSGAPITTWANRDEAFHSVSKSIYELVKKWQDNSLQKTIPTKIAELGSWGYVGQKRLSKKQTNTPIKIFIVYSHEDTTYFHELRKHLKILERSYFVKISNNNEIIAGRSMQQAYEEELYNADLILFLVSLDLIASDEHYEMIEKTLQRHKKGKVNSVPIILSPTYWEDIFQTPLAKQTILPKNGIPIKKWANRDEVYIDITHSIFDMVEEIYEQKKTSQAQTLIAQAKAEGRKRLDLGNCGLTDLEKEVPELFELEKLEELVLSNMWWDWNKKTWVNSTNKGTKNKLTQLPQTLNQLSLLKTLIFGGEMSEPWQIDSIDTIQQLPQLQHLQLRYCGITNITAISQLSQLQHLDLSGNAITSIDPLKHLTQLIHLRANGNQISDPSPLNQLHLLKYAELCRNQITTIKALYPIVSAHNLNLVYLETNIKDNCISLYNNPIPKTELSVMERGKEAVLHYMEQSVNVSTPVKIFIDYAEEDKVYFDELYKHLFTLQRRGDIKIWHQGMAFADYPLDETIKQNLHNSDIALMLTSVDFLAPDNSYYRLENALARHQKGECLVVPIVLRTCLWDYGIEFVDLQALPKGGKPINNWANRDEAFQSVSKSIYELVEKWQEKHKTHQAITLTTQQNFAQAFTLLDTLNLQNPLYYQLKREYTSGVYRNDFNYADRLITFLKTL